jgi:deazaflavin-dependent oxidoreductase (nitroreductase family)
VSPTEPSAAVQEPACLYLTTIGRRSGQPREIELWFTAWDGRWFVIAETGARAQWLRNIEAEPRVRWRVGDTTRTGRARAVSAVAEPELARTVQRRSAAKYGWGDGLVVELTPDPPLA